jgi:hypothetical protein
MYILFLFYKPKGRRGYKKTSSEAASTNKNQNQSTLIVSREVIKIHQKKSQDCSIGALL